MSDTPPPDRHRSPLRVGARVDVRSRFDGTWATGYEVVEADDDGYRVRRIADGEELPVRFSRDEVRRERRRQTWWV